MDKFGFLLFLLGGAGMDSPDRTIPVIMVILGLTIMALSSYLERRGRYGISYKICKWKIPQSRDQPKRFIGVVICVERRSRRDKRLCNRKVS